MLELMDKDIKDGENAIFLFEIGDFSHIQKSADEIYEAGYTLMNSIKFNEVDWTIVVKKVKPEPKPVKEIEEDDSDEDDDDDE
jgi:NADH-quinone oxidoreductase subunit E